MRKKHPKYDIIKIYFLLEPVLTELIEEYFLGEFSMDYNHLISVGKIIRKERKKESLKQSDLADENISTPTISAIERGMPNVSEEKRTYLCNKLKIKNTSLKHAEEKLKYEEIQLGKELHLIEARINLVDPNKALDTIKMLESTKEVNHEYMKCFLMAKCYFNKRKWKRSRQLFKKTLIINNKNPYLNQTNIAATSYKELARISYFETNNIVEALNLVNKGIEIYDPNGERKDSIYYLLIGKVLYLEKINRIESAMNTLETLWQSIHDIKNLDIILNMYEMKALLLSGKMKFYSQALSFAIEGFEMAHSNQKHERAVELLNTWGNICVKMKDLEMAEKCYKIALELEDQVNKNQKYLFITTYTQLGNLYLLQNRIDESFTNLQQANKLALTSKSIHRYNNALIALGNHYLQIQLYQKAINPYLKALDQAKIYGLQKQEILSKLSICWKNVGMQGKYIETLEELQLELQKDEEFYYSFTEL